MTEIRLTGRQISVGAHVGALRVCQCIRDGSTHVNNKKPSAKDWSDHIESACAEFALAEFLGVSWGGARTIRAPDVGDDLEVKHSVYANAHLLIQRDQPNETRMVLVTGQLGIYRVRGWLRAGDGKRTELWRDHNGNDRPAFWVPQSELNPIEGIMK